VVSHTLAVTAALAICASLLPATARAQAPAPDTLARGEYLTRAADCMACHTVPGSKPYAGGLPFKLPFGTLYAPNITADKATGIGDWSDADFLRAMHQGVGKGGIHYYPAFPYPSYTLLADDDVLAIKAYLFSLPAVAKQTPENSLRFPYNQRWLMWFWNILYNPDKRFAPDPARPADWNRGAYLVEALGHCGDCHTPRNFLQAPKTSEKFAGAIVEGWRAYNITADREAGVGAWSDQQIADYLATGHAEHRGSAAGPMALAVEDSLSYLRPEDTKAMVAYLRTVAPIPNAEHAAAAPNPPAAANPGPGAHVFEGACASCHAPDGSGVETPYAELAGSSAITDPAATNATQVVLQGAHLRTREGEVLMPAFAKGYSDDEIAAVVNYVTGLIGGRATQLTADDIRKRRDAQ